MCLYPDLETKFYSLTFLVVGTCHESDAVGYSKKLGAGGEAYSETELHSCMYFISHSRNFLLNLNYFKVGRIYKIRMCTRFC